MIIRQFKESLDAQINTNIFAALKEEEWLLESVGLNTLSKNNLIPTPEQPIKVKDVYEAFLRFDDKPMITGIGAVSQGLLRYCTNGEFCIATGDGTNFTKFYFQENVPFFEVTDSTYWLVHKSLKPQAATVTPGNPPYSEPNVQPPISNDDGGNLSGGQPIEPGNVRKFNAITISGKVPLERYTELFSCFIAPFAMTGNKIDIEVKFKIKSSESSPLDESKQQYKSAKEASKQLGLDFMEE